MPKPFLARATFVGQVASHDRGHLNVANPLAAFEMDGRSDDWYMPGRAVMVSVETTLTTLFFRDERYLEFTQAFQPEGFGYHESAAVSLIPVRHRWNMHFSKPAVTLLSPEQYRTMLEVTAKVDHRELVYSKKRGLHQQPTGFLSCFLDRDPPM